jgi:hypothetical protein
LDSIKEIFEAMGQRVRSPFYGYTALSFILINWKPLYYICFSGESAEAKFTFFDADTDHWDLYVLPLVFGILAALLSPYLSNFGSWWATKPINARRLRETNAAHEIMQAKNRWTVERENERALYEQSLIEQAKRDQEIAAIEDEEVRTSLESAVTEFRDISDENWDRNLSGKDMESGRLTEFADRLAKTQLKAGAKRFSVTGGGRVYALVQHSWEATGDFFEGVDFVFTNDTSDEKGKKRAVKVVRYGDTLLVGDTVPLLKREIDILHNEGVTLVRLPRKRLINEYELQSAPE